MKLLKITREDSFVQIRFEAKGPAITANNPEKPGETSTFQSTQDSEVTAYEAPLKSFDKALQALADVVVKVLEMDRAWRQGLKIRSVTISHAKHGTRSVAITFLKDLDATGLPHRMTTPSFRIDDSDEGRAHVAKPHAAMVVKVFEEARKYVQGERQQLTLSIEGTKKKEDDTTAPLALGGEE
jgi:hypothetical protein